MSRFSQRLVVVAWLSWLAMPDLVRSDSGAIAESGEIPFSDESAMEVIGRETRGILDSTSAHEALRLGFPSIAVGLYAQLVEDAPAERSDEYLLGLASALLDLNRVEEAGEALDRMSEKSGARYWLRAAAVELLSADIAGAEAAMERIIPGELPADELAWMYFIRGMLADAEGDFARAQREYEEARSRARTEARRARFLAGQIRSRILFARADDALAAQLKKQMEDFQGRRIGYQFAQQYVTVLTRLGRRDEAVRVLEEQLQLLPIEEREIADDLRLLLAIVAGSGSGSGRSALRQILLTGVTRPTQRAALQMLLVGSSDPDSRTQLERELAELAAREPPHPLSEEILAALAHLSLLNGNLAGAETSARGLLSRYPGSQLRSTALGTLAAVAWELRRYRTAADWISQWQSAVDETARRRELDALQAEAWFRAGDYQAAVDAYERALQAGMEGDLRDALVYQRALASIRAGRRDEAAHFLDESAMQREVNPELLWRAEWNLLKAQQLAGEGAEAFARVNRLLADGEVASRDLRMRLRWLQVRLALESGDAGRAFELARAFAADLESLTEPGRLRTDVAATVLLLQAQALFALARAEEGVERLERLRREYARTDAAIFSFIIQAEHLSALNQTVEAQQLLIRMVDTHRESPYAPFALFEAALNAERRGLPAQLEEAYRILERLALDFPRSPLVFRARLRQGDLLRKLNEFGPAQQIYEFLVINHPDHPDVLLAEMALADCLYAQAASDPSRLESALARYERLSDLSHAPAELRIEAGFKFGYALSRRGSGERAAAVFAGLVGRFLDGSDPVEEFGATGRYWMSRTLLELGAVLESQGRFEEARNAYEKIISSGLAGYSLARARLARFNVPEQ